MVFFVLLMLLIIQGFIAGYNIELKANVGKCLVVGETLELKCSITNSNEINNLNLNQFNIRHSGSRLVNQSIIGDRTIQAVISDVEKGDGGIYTCRYKRDLKMSKGLVFQVTDPNPMPEDIDCIATGEVTRVDCTWESRDLCTTWRLFYSKTNESEAKCVLPVQTVPKDCAEHTVDSNKDIKSRCHQLPYKGKPMQLRCRVDILFESDFRLRLERNSPSGTETKIFHKRFDDTIVKLDALQNLQVHSSSTAIALGWKFQNPPIYYENGICCNVSCGMETKTLIFPGNSTNYEVRRIMFNDLHPFTEYNITVICQVAGSRYWGDPLYRTYQTEEDVPLDGPHTTDASYTLAGCNAGVPGTCLTIHTNQKDKLNANGNICGYADEIQSRQGPTIKQQFDFSNTSTSLEIGPLDNRILPPFHVSIWSKTSKGLSNRSTDIVIILNKDIAFQEVIVEEQDANYLITADILPNSASSVIICHWCYGFKIDKSVTCKVGYGYKNSSKPEFLIEKSELDESSVITEEDSKYQWHFGMSVSAGAATTGIHWEDCMFQAVKHVQSPPQPEEPVLSEGIRNQIVVHVQPFCPPVNSNIESVRPMNYTVVCTNKDEFNDVRTKTFEARYNDDRLEINDLEPGSTYKVRYSIGYRQGTSPFSEPASKYISTQPQIELVVGLAVGITFVLLFGILMIWKLAKWYHKIEQPIEGVEIDKNNLDKSNVYPTDHYDEICVESSQADDVKSKILAECTKAHESLHQASNILGSEPDSKNFKLASHSCSDIFNSQYKIIGSITGGEDFDVDKSVVIEDEICPDKSFASEDRLNIVDEQTANAIQTFHQSTTSDTTATSRELSVGDEIDISKKNVSTSSVYSDKCDKADNTQLSPNFMGNKPMTECCRSLSEVMIDQDDIAVTLLSAPPREVIDDEDVSYQQHIRDLLEMQHNSIVCTDQQQQSEITKNSMSEKPIPPSSGYKRLPEAETCTMFRPKGPEMFKTDDEQFASDDDLEFFLPTEPFALVGSLDTQQLDIMFKLDDTSSEPTDQICVLGRITEPARSRKSVKTHYKTLPVS